MSLPAGLVQVSTAAPFANGVQAATFAARPTPGSLIVACLCSEDIALAGIAGFTALPEAVGPGGSRVGFAWKRAGAGEPLTYSTTTFLGINTGFQLFEIAGGVLGADGTTTAGPPPPSPIVGPSLAPARAPAILLGGVIGKCETFNGPATFAAVAPMVTASTDRRNPGRGNTWRGYRELLTTAAASFSVTNNLAALRNDSVAAAGLVVVPTLAPGFAPRFW